MKFTIVRMKEPHKSLIYRASKVLNIPANSLHIPTIALLFGENKDTKTAYKRLILANQIINAAKDAGLSPQDVIDLIKKSKE